MNEFLSGAHPHLLVNHVPILGAVFALCLLVVSYRYAGDILRRTAFVVLVATALGAAAADYTGDDAKDAVRGLPGVGREQIRAHEDAAERAYVAAGLLGVLALGALVRWRATTVPQGVAFGMLGGAAVVGGLMAYTGLLGGRVRHTELRPGAVPSDALVIEPPRAPRPAP
ncbi:MAG: hypothetical protein ABJE47_09015 [bacterium]